VKAQEEPSSERFRISDLSGRSIKGGAQEKFRISDLSGRSIKGGAQEK